ncbi:transposase [Gillisia limnaea]|uniref:transposase n=1 Tax=Gillisia limnaea TaxID=195907 RepID=UPI00247A1B23|nr:transposase [Gillisia limnaea]
MAKKCFPKAKQVTERFHVQKLATETLQDFSIKHRCEAIDLEKEELCKISFFECFQGPKHTSKLSDTEFAPF